MCNASPLSSYAGFGGMFGTGFGGLGANPFLSAGFSPGFIGGMGGFGMPGMYPGWAVFMVDLEFLAQEELVYMVLLVDLVEWAAWNGAWLMGLGMGGYPGIGFGVGLGLGGWNGSWSRNAW